MTSLPSDRLPVVVWGAAPEVEAWRAIAAEQASLSITYRESFAAAVAAAAAVSGAHVVLVASAVTVSRDLRTEVGRAVGSAELAGVPWLLLAGAGQTLDGAIVDNGAYLDHAALAEAYPVRALVAAGPQLAVLSTAALAAGAGDGATSPPDLVARGWRAGWASFVSPHLRFAVPAPRHEYAAGWEAGDVPPRPDAQTQMLGSLRSDPTLTVVVRTALARPHLLARTLASLAEAARVAGPPEAVLLVGTVAADDLAAATDRQARAWPDLPLARHAVPDTGAPERTAALVAGLERATTDYVWFVDDDDVATPDSLRSIRNAVHAVHAPLIVGPSIEVVERWRDDRLESSEEVRTWDPEEWYRCFTGWNLLPICSLVFPRPVALARVREVPLRHDLGEDYALARLTMTAPGQTVVTVPRPIARVSVRPGGDNVVTLSDRTAWLRDSAGFAGDLAADLHAGGQVVWSLGRVVRDSVPVSKLKAQQAQLAEPRWRTWGKRIIPARLQPAAARAVARFRRTGSSR